MKLKATDETPMMSTTIAIYDLPSKATEEPLRMLFGAYGTIQEVVECFEPTSARASRSKLALE